MHSQFPFWIYLAGLDSFSAMQICQVLRKVADAGASVLFTIHQPASEVFKSFDRLILMNKGQVMYQGLVSAVPSTFEQRGYEVPPYHNPADFVMQIVQTRNTAELEAAGFFDGNQLSLGGAQALNDHARDELGISIRESGKQTKQGAWQRPGFFQQVVQLFVREVANLRRNKTVLKGRLGMTIMLSLFMGLIFLDVADEDFSVPSNLQSAFGGLIMVALASMVSTALPSLVQFPEERPVFLREYSTNHYSVAAYFVSRLTMEAVVTGVQVMLCSILTYFMISYPGDFGLYFLSMYVLAMTSTALGVMAACSVEDPGVAMEFMPAIIVPQMIFAGFFVTPDLIPVWLRWLRYLFPLTYVIRILLVENFADCPIDPTTGINQCDILLDKVDADPDETWWYWLVVALLFVVFRLMALYNLHSKATKFY